MKNADFHQSISTLFMDLFNEEISPPSFVRQFDHLMADCLPNDIDSDLLAVLDSFQMETAMYQPDAKLRLQAPKHLIGEQALHACARLAWRLICKESR